MPGTITFRTIPTGSVDLHVAQAGPENGPLVVLLHGFPEFWYGWHKQIPALAAAGFRVWVPDQRGYNLSTKPTRVSEYTLDKLAQDVVGVIEAAKVPKATIVGHDWGGAVAWWLAAHRPDLVERLVIVNVPHPAVLRRMILTNPRQTLRSWYMFAIQVPWLPERAISRDYWRPMIEGMQTSSRPGTFTSEDFEQYRQAWSQPGAFTAMLHWYRALFRYGVPGAKDPKIMSPTLILWGRNDKFILPEAAEASANLCRNARLVHYDAATHWLQHEEPEDVSRRIVEFLA